MSNNTKRIVISNLSLSRKRNLDKIAIELGVPIGCLFKLEVHEMHKELSPKITTNYAAK